MWRSSCQSQHLGHHHQDEMEHFRWISSCWYLRIFFTHHTCVFQTQDLYLHQFAISKGQAKYCWWFRNPKQSPGMVLKPCKQWDNLPYKLVGWISEPSTVSLDKVAKTHPKNAPVAVHCHHNHQVQGCAAVPVPWPTGLGVGLGCWEISRFGEGPQGCWISCRICLWCQDTYMKILVNICVYQIFYTL